MDINKLIKTECGQTKYAELSQRKGVIPRIRLAWFVFFAVIKDWNLPKENYSEKSKS